MTQIVYYKGLLIADTKLYNDEMIRSTDKVFQKETDTHIYTCGIAGLDIVVPIFRDHIIGEKLTFPEKKEIMDYLGDKQDSDPYMSSILVKYNKTTKEIQAGYHDLIGNMTLIKDPIFAVGYYSDAIELHYKSLERNGLLDKIDTKGMHIIEWIMRDLLIPTTQIQLPEYEIQFYDVTKMGKL